MSTNRLENHPFADGTYDFYLPLPRLRELQQKTSTGIGGLYARMLKGVMEVGNKVFLDPGTAEFFAEDIIETIRQGLIGGGRGVVNGEEVRVTPVVAERLIQNYVLIAPLYDHWSLAIAVLGVCVKGYDPPKKDEPAPEAGSPRKSRKAGSTTA